jgi:hypothetical protein
LSSASKHHIPLAKDTQTLNFLKRVHIDNITSSIAPNVVDTDIWDYVWELDNKYRHTPEYKKLIDDRCKESAAELAKLEELNFKQVQSDQFAAFLANQKTLLVAHKTRTFAAKAIDDKASKDLAAFIKEDEPKKAGGKRKASKETKEDTDDDDDQSTKRPKSLDIRVQAIPFPSSSSMLDLSVLD